MKKLFDTRAIGNASIACATSPEKPSVTSGVCPGTAAATSRGFGARKSISTGERVLQVVRALSPSDSQGDCAIEARALKRGEALRHAHPANRTGRS